MTITPLQMRALKEVAASHDAMLRKAWGDQLDALERKGLVEITAPRTTYAGRKYGLTDAGRAILVGVTP